MPTDVNEKLVHGDFGNFIKGQKLDKKKEKKYKEPPYKDLAASVDLDGELTEKKMTKKQMKKRDEIADAISKKDMKNRYGDENVRYAIGTKLAMKENITDSELVIQDWNVDDIKFTEIETVDIIKAKPLKENRIEKIKSRPMPDYRLRRETKPAPMPGYRLDSETKPAPMPNYRSGSALDRFEKIPGKPGRLRPKQDAKVKPVPLPKPPKRPGAATPVPMPQPNFRKLPERKPMPLRPGDKVERKPMPLRPGDKVERKPMKDHYDWRNELGEDVASKLKMKLLNKKEGGTSKPGFPPIKTIEKRVKMDEDWQKVNRKDKTDGLSKKAVKAYRRENPGSKLKTAVTKDPKKLKKGSKDAKRRLSFCRRMKGMKKRLTSAKTARDPDSRINKALRRWNC